MPRFHPPPVYYYLPPTRYGAPAYVVPPHDRGSGGWSYGGSPSRWAPPAYAAPDLEVDEE